MPAGVLVLMLENKGTHAPIIRRAGAVAVQQDAKAELAEFILLTALGA